MICDELRYILDPKEVYDDDFTGETVRVVKEKEFKQFGDAPRRTKISFEYGEYNVLSRCSEFLSYCVGLGLSLMGKETQSRGTFQIDIPCLQLVT